MKYYIGALLYRQLSTSDTLELFSLSGLYWMAIPWTLTELFAMAPNLKETSVPEILENGFLCRPEYRAALLQNFV